jgi:ATP-dependent DNA ligase
MNFAPIIPTIRHEPFDDPAWLFDLKLDGFRGVADTVNGRMLSKNGNTLKRFERLLDALPSGFVFDGEIVALDDDGRPMFNDLLFGRREPVYVAFDVLVVDGEDVRALPLKERRALLDKVPFAATGCRGPSRSWLTARRRSGRSANWTWRASLPSGWPMPMSLDGRGGGRS